MLAAPAGRWFPGKGLDTLQHGCGTSADSRVGGRS